MPGQKVQLRKASAYLGGQRVLRLPYHEVSLAEGISPQGQQYIGVGSQGLTVDLPYFLTMAPSASTSLRLQRGSRTGFGWYGTNPDWQLNLQRQYGLPGATEGIARASWQRRRAATAWAGGPPGGPNPRGCRAAGASAT